MRNGIVNYQVLEKKNRAGKYIPDYEAFIRDAACDEEAECIRHKQQRDKQDELTGNPEEAGFLYRFVFVVRNACGHYGMYQRVYSDGDDISGCISYAEFIAALDCQRCMNGEDELVEDLPAEQVEDE